MKPSNAMDQKSEDKMDKAKKRKIVTVACDSCRRMKVKCNGESPCERCSKGFKECVYAVPKKRGPPKSQGGVHSTPPSHQNIASEKVVRYIKKNDELGFMYVVNYYLYLHIQSATSFFGEATGKCIKYFLVEDDKPWSYLQKYSVLSIISRSHGDVHIANHFLAKAEEEASQEETETSMEHILQTASSMSLLSSAATKRYKSKIYATMAKRNLEKVREHAFSSGDEMFLLCWIFLHITVDEIGPATITERDKEYFAKSSTITEDFMDRNGFVKVYRTIPQFTSFPTVWKRLEMIERMSAIGRLINGISPSVFCSIYSEELNIDSLRNAYGSISTEMADMLLQDVQVTTKTLSSLLTFNPMGDVPWALYEFIIYYASGQYEKCLQSAQQMIYIFDSQGEHFMCIAVRVFSPLFIASCFLIENRIVSMEATIINIFSKFATRHPLCDLALSALSEFKMRKMAQLHDSSPDTEWKEATLTYLEEEQVLTEEWIEKVLAF